MIEVSGTSKLGTYLLALHSRGLSAEQRVSARWGWAGEIAAFLSILTDIIRPATALGTCS